MVVCAVERRSASGRGAVRVENPPPVYTTAAVSMHPLPLQKCQMCSPSVPKRHVRPDGRVITSQRHLPPSVSLAALLALLLLLWGCCCACMCRCRQKTLEDHVSCSHPNCGKGKRMPTSFW